MVNGKTICIYVYVCVGMRICIYVYVCVCVCVCVRGGGVIKCYVLTRTYGRLVTARSSKAYTVEI